MAKAVLFLHSSEKEDLLKALSAELESLVGAQPHVTAQLLAEPAQDLFYDPGGPHRRPQAVLELITAPGLPLSAVQGRLIELLQEAPVQRESCAYVMQARWYIPAPSQAVHYHHLLVRRPEFSRADFNDYYSNFHCRMGFNTGGIAGYAQNYIDTEASLALAATLGFSCPEIDAISELTMCAMESLASAPGLAEVGAAAAADEARFVDREQSLFFCSEVVARAGDFNAIGEPVYPQYYGAASSS